MIFYKQCYLGLFTTVFIILELTQNVLATDCDTFSKIVKNMGETAGGGAYVTFTDCCKAAGVTCDANQNIIELSFSKFSGYGGNMNGFYQELQNLTSLTSLEIVDFSVGNYNKNTNATLPKTIGNMKNLKTLIIRNDYLDNLGFRLPEEIGNLINLEKLDLSDNVLSGPLPKSIGNLKNLKILNLKGNDFTETIPYEFKNLQNLEEINLNGNTNLKGYVPPLPKLKTCDYGVSGLCRLPNTCGDYVDVCTTDEIKNYNKQNGNPNQTENVDLVSKGSSTDSGSSSSSSSSSYSSSFDSSSSDSSDSIFSRIDFLSLILKNSKLIFYVFLGLIFIIAFAITSCAKCIKKPNYDSQPHLEKQNNVIIVDDISPKSNTNNTTTTITTENDKVPINTTYSAAIEPPPVYSLTNEQNVMPSPKDSTSDAPLQNNYSAYAAMNTSMNTSYIPSVPVSPAVTVPPVGYAPPAVTVPPVGYAPPAVTVPPVGYIPPSGYPPYPSYPPPAESEYKK